MSLLDFLNRRRDEQKLVIIVNDRLQTMDFHWQGGKSRIAQVRTVTRQSDGVECLSIIMERVECR